MKTKPTIQNAFAPPAEITRTAAADYFRRERKLGKVLKLMSGYLLPAQEKFIVCPRAPRPAPPPEPFPLSVRLTHKYNEGWSSLDRWMAVTMALCVKSKPPKVDDYDGSFSQLLLVKVEPCGFRQDNIVRAIESTMTRSCRCEHDCCGHVHSSVSKVRKIARDLFAVRIAGCRNL